MADAVKKTILVVDDEPDIRKYLTRLLIDNGYETLTADNGEEGLAVARNDHPDAICLDIVMPEKSGVRMYRDLCADPELAKIPVVVVTGVTKEFENFISSRRSVPPPKGYVSKPIVTDELLEKISRALA